MKQITLNIPSGYDDVITVTCVGGAGTPVINVNAQAFDLTKIKDKCEFDVIPIGGEDNDKY